MKYNNIIRIKNFLRQRVLPHTKKFPHNFNLNKKDLIDFTFQELLHLSPFSFIDLGAVWGVDGAYTFYTLDQYNISNAFLVDTGITGTVLKRSRKYKNLVLITGNFGDKSTINQLKNVDAIFFFDILLHQVKPDWDEILEMYAPLTKCFVVYNQQYIASETTVRLLDLGKDQYFENVPHDRDHPTYKALFEKMYEIHPQHNRIWRDIHNVWQWGITNRDLCTKLETLGFIEKYQKNCGQHGNLSNFQNHVFVFQR